MNLFETLYDNITRIITEKVFPHELYHYTHVHKVSEMVKTDTIMLSFANIDGPDREVNKGKYFFLSLSYDKWGRYAGGTVGQRYKSNLYGSQVTLVFNTDALNSQGKLVDADYWEQDYENSEKEVRFISDNQTLKGASKYISEIHVYIPQTRHSKDSWGEDKVDHPEIHEIELRHFNRLEESNIPTYFYNKPNAFKLLLKRTASQKYIDMMPPTIERVNRNSGYSRKDTTNNQISNLLHYFKTNEIPPNDRFNHIKNMKDSIMRGYERDIKATINNDLHNAKRSHPEAFQGVVDFLKQNKLNTMDELITFLKERN